MDQDQTQEEAPVVEAEVVSSAEAQPDNQLLHQDHHHKDKHQDHHHKDKHQDQPQEQHQLKLQHKPQLLVVV